MYGGREALPDDHKFRGQRGRVRARYRRPQLGRGTEKIGETSQRKTNLQLASGAFSCKLRRSRRQVSARRKLHRAVDAQVAMANSIPWSSTAKFSRNGVLVALTRHSYIGPADDAGRTQGRRQIPPVKRRPRNQRGGLAAVTDFLLPYVHSLKLARPCRPLPMLIIATSRPIAISTRCPMRAISAAQRCSWVSLTSLSALKEIPAAAFLQGRSSTSMMSATFPPIQSQTSARSFYFAFNKLRQPSIGCIPGRVIPLAQRVRRAPPRN